MPADKFSPRGSMLPFLGRFQSDGEPRETPEQALHMLAYLGDMAAELQEMAAQLNCPTLASLLDLASREADLQAAQRRQHDVNPGQPG